MAHRVGEKIGSSVKEGKVRTKCIAGEGLAGYMCGSGLQKKFECGPIMGAFGCVAPFDCPGSKFGCEGGWFDDFECMGKDKFQCIGKEFHCGYSFDEEDCEGSFSCEKDKKFDCKESYN